MAEHTPPSDEETKALIEEQTQNIIVANKAYVKRLEYIINRIGETVTKENKDRLDYAHIIDESVNILTLSVQGWKKWTNIRTMHDVMTEEELKIYSQKMFELVKAWIQIDIDITNGKTAIDEKKLKDKKTKKNENYVS